MTEFSESMFVIIIRIRSISKKPPSNNELSKSLVHFFNWQLNATFVQRRQHHPLHQCLFSGLSPKKNDEQKPFFKECSEATFADTDSMVINVSTVISATYSCLTFLKACLYSVNWTATGAQ